MKIMVDMTAKEWALLRAVLAALAVVGQLKLLARKFEDAYAEALIRGVGQYMTAARKPRKVIKK